MPPKRHANLSGKLKSHADGEAVKGLAKVFKSAASLKDLPTWAGTLPCIEYPSIKMNRRPTAACKHALAKHSDLMKAIQRLCNEWGKALKLERTTIRDALLEAFVAKSTIKHESKASTLATRLYLMITHQRRINKGSEATAEDRGTNFTYHHRFPGGPSGPPDPPDGAPMGPPGPSSITWGIPT